MPISPGPSARRLPRRRAAAVAATGALVLAAALVPSAASADGPPAVGEIVASDNVEHVANIPKSGPFASQASYNSDLAFTGDYAIGGNYDGFVVYDISDPESPSVVSQVLCPGGQGDVSVSGDLLYFSVDYPRADEDCGSPAASAGSATAFEGVRVFDISDKANPQYVAAVRTDCGSHTHTLIQTEERRGRGGRADVDYLYVSSYSPSAGFPNCRPPHDKISVIRVAHDDPGAAKVVNEPVLFPDGGNPGGTVDGNRIAATTGCHDITVYTERDIAAGACMGDGVIMDISDPVNPTVVERVRDDENFAFWHSATFSNDGRRVLFTDELGGGGAATCLPGVGDTHGANAFYDLKGRIRPNGADDVRLDFAGYFKIPRDQTSTENCVAHNGSLIPVKGKDYFVQSWYQGGVSVIDFNEPSAPEEIGYFDRGPLSDTRLSLGGSWSAYYYNGYVYSSDIQMGLDVLRIDDPRLRNADRVTMDEFNPQNQFRY
ncbi:LVIVD repeat-containing protein [Actinorugispora endophytica]|uniref:LVIVD repeat-containing protein n=1 Tax=Actinorugispora endophytica TaxID=1605990 RepID=A0A4R6UIY3_9ACTN|nr:hypothetical protein [Actinorugispora endophytica]TDQ46880.1 LVIVD repeat-containing protein [Actinorugispora endophytica]